MHYMSGLDVDIAGVGAVFYIKSLRRRCKYEKPPPQGLAEV